MNKKSTISLLFALCICSCGVEQKPSNINIDYIINPYQNKIPSSDSLSTLVEQYKIIPLESKDEALISYIYKVEIIDDKLFIFDKKGLGRQGKLLVFDMNGKYLYRIGTNGNALNEYIALGSFAINRLTKEVIIHDDMSNKLLYYDLNGVFIKSVTSDFIARQIEVLPNGDYLFIGGGKGNDRLILTNSKCEIKEKHFPSNGKNWVMQINAFTKDKENIIYRNYLNDTIYSISPQKGVYASRFVDFGKNALSWSEFSKFSKSEQNDIESQFPNYACNLKYYSETDDFIWFFYSDKGIPRCVTYDKKSKQSLTYNIDTFNNITFDKYVPLIVGSSNDYFIGQSNINSIIELMDELEYSNDAKYLQMLDIAQRSNANSNPVLALIKFKEIKN